MSHESRSPEEAGQPLSFLAAALWTALVVLLELFIVSLTEEGREGAYLDLVSRTASEALAYSLVLFAILRVHEPQTSVRHVLALRRPSVLAILLCIVVGMALSLPSEWVGQILDARFPRSPEEQEAFDKVFSVATSGKRITLVVTLGLLQPIFDELFYRGALFTPLRRTRTAESVVVATAAFETLRSGMPRTMMLLLVASLVFAWIRSATGSIFPAIVARIAYMGVGLAPIVLVRELPRPTIPWVAASVAGAVLGIVGLAALSRSAEARRLDE